MGKRSRSNEPSVGCILWIKKDVHPILQAKHQLDEEQIRHPVVLVRLETPVSDIVQVCMVTSKGGKNVNDMPRSHKSRRNYVPIFPSPHNEALPDIQLRMDNLQLRKASYINIQKSFMLPKSLLVPYNRSQPANYYRLDPESVCLLQECISSGIDDASNPNNTPLTYKEVTPLLHPAQTLDFEGQRSLLGTMPSTPAYVSTTVRPVINASYQYDTFRPAAAARSLPLPVSSLRTTKVRSPWIAALRWLTNLLITTLQWSAKTLIGALRARWPSILWCVALALFGYCSYWGFHWLISQVSSLAHLVAGMFAEVMDWLRSFITWGLVKS